MVMGARPQRFASGVCLLGTKGPLLRAAASGEDGALRGTQSGHAEGAGCRCPREKTGTTPVSKECAVMGLLACLFAKSSGMRRMGALVLMLIPASKPAATPPPRAVEEGARHFGGH